MVYAGNGMWWLGVVKDDTPAMVEGLTLCLSNRRREMQGLPVRKATALKADLMRQGFRLLAGMGTRDGGADPTPGQCVRMIAPALFATYKEEEAANDAAERESDGTAARERSDALLHGEFLQYHARDVYRTSKRFSVLTAASAPEPSRSV